MGRHMAVWCILFTPFLTLCTICVRFRGWLSEVQNQDCGLCDFGVLNLKMQSSLPAMYFKDLS